MPDDWYRNEPISKENAKVFKPAGCCICCSNGKPSYTREHVMPRGMGGGIIFPEASCEECRRTIFYIETYCMRGPFLSHRLHAGLVNNLTDLGNAIKMPIIVDGKRHERAFPVSDYPKFLVLPAFHDPPRLVTGRPESTTGVSLSIWGDEEQLRALHKEGDAIFVENFNIDKFSRALAKIAHGLAVGEWGIENLEPLLPQFILGRAPERGSLLIGNWGEDGMARSSNLLHQVGLAFAEDREKVRIDARIRLFAALDNTPVYRVLVGYLNKPLDDVLAPRGMRSLPIREKG